MTFISYGKKKPKPPPCPMCGSKNIKGLWREVYDRFSDPYPAGEMLIRWECLDCLNGKTYGRVD